jgi:hypothetical protein
MLKSINLKILNLPVRIIRIFATRWRIPKAIKGLNNLDGLLKVSSNDDL